jgi:hypothetical protein
MNFFSRLYTALTPEPVIQIHFRFFSQLADIKRYLCVQNLTTGDLHRVMTAGYQVSYINGMKRY